MRSGHEEAVEKIGDESNQKEGPEVTQPETRTTHRQVEQEQEREEISDAGELDAADGISAESEGQKHEVEAIPDVGLEGADDGVSSPGEVLEEGAVLAIKGGVAAVVEGIAVRNVGKAEVKVGGEAEGDRQEEDGGEGAGEAAVTEARKHR
jgi:hypothetical protein